jgi:TRAP-type C4-dicarboxylate transport system permease small subunit
MQFIRRFDRLWARGEGALTVMVLIMMVLVAGFQAFIRNLTRWDVQWASELLYDMEWADSFLRKGTLWLAFLGASMATYYGRHIGIDILVRIAPPRAKYVMRAMSNLMAGIVTIGLVVCFSSAVYLNLTERPLEYEVLGEEGSMHVCDAADSLLEELEFEKPTAFCVFRKVLAVMSVPAETPGAAFQLVVPIMFFAVALRLLARGIGAVLILAGGESAIEAAQAEEAREAAERARAAGSSDSLVPPAAPGTTADVIPPAAPVPRNLPARSDAETESDAPTVAGADDSVEPEEPAPEPEKEK